MLCVSIQQPWHSTMGIHFPCRVCGGGCLLASQTLTHGPSIFFLVPAGWACRPVEMAEVERTNRTRPGLSLLPSLRTGHYCHPCFVPLTEASLLAKPEVRGQGNLFYFMTWKEPQAHMTKGVSRGRGEGQGLHYIQPVQSTALPVMFSWEFCDSEVASLTFPITRGILIYVT